MMMMTIPADTDESLQKNDEDTIVCYSRVILTNKKIAFTLFPKIE